MENGKEKYNFFTPATYNFFYIILNTKNEKLSDKRVRRALAHLLEINKMVEVLYGGYGQPIAHPFPSEAPYFRKDLPLIEYSPEKAAQLLDEAGWTDTDGDGIRDKEINGVSTPLSLQYLNSGTIFSTNLFQTFKDNASKVGVEITSRKENLTPIVREFLPARDFELYGGQSSADPVATMDPFPLWHTSSDNPKGANRAGFGTDESDALIDDIKKTLDDEKRYAMMGQLQEIIYNEQPWLMLFTPQERMVIHKRFDGQGYRLKPGIHARLLKKK